MFEHLDDRCAQIGVGPRLGYETEDPRVVDRAHDAVEVGACGKHHSGGVGLQPLRHRQERRAVHFRHPIIRNDDIDRMRTQVVERIVRRSERNDMRIGNGRHRRAVHAHAAQRVENVGFVIDDKETRHAMPLCCRTQDRPSRVGPNSACAGRRTNGMPQDVSKQHARGYLATQLPRRRGIAAAARQSVTRNATQHAAVAQRRGRRNCEPFPALSAPATHRSIRDCPRGRNGYGARRGAAPPPKTSDCLPRRTQRVSEGETSAQALAAAPVLAEQRAAVGDPLRGQLFLHRVLAAGARRGRRNRRGRAAGPG